MVGVSLCRSRSVLTLLVVAILVVTTQACFTRWGNQKVNSGQNTHNMMRPADPKGECHLPGDVIPDEEDCKAYYVCIPDGGRGWGKVRRECAQGGYLDLATLTCVEGTCHAKEF